MNNTYVRLGLYLALKGVDRSWYIAEVDTIFEDEDFNRYYPILRHSENRSCEVKIPMHTAIVNDEYFYVGIDNQDKQVFFNKIYDN